MAKEPKKTQRQSLCGQVFDNGIAGMKHEAQCPQCLGLRGLIKQGKLGTLLEKAKEEGLVAEAPQRTEDPAAHKQEEGENSPAAPKKDRQKPQEEVELGEYALPGPGPERLMEVLKNQRFAKVYAEAICRSFMGARWAWMETPALINFLQMHQIPYPQAMAIAAEYFGQPPGGMGGMGPGMGFPGQMQGMGFPGYQNPYMQNPMNPYGGGMGGMGPMGPMGMFPWWLMPPFPPPGGIYERPQPAPAPAPAPQGESVAAAALAAMGTVVTAALTKKDDDGGVGAALAQSEARMDDKVGFLTSLQTYQDRMSASLDAMKDAQVAETRRQNEALQARIAKMEERNPLQDFGVLRQTLSGFAQDMGYAPPGSQDIYGAISGGIKDVNQTIQTGINALASRGQRDRSLEERRAKAETVLQEEKMLGRAMSVIRRAQEQRQAQAAPAGGEPPPEPPLGRMTPVHPPAPSPATSQSAPVPEEAPA